MINLKKKKRRSKTKLLKLQWKAHLKIFGIKKKKKLNCLLGWRNNAFREKRQVIIMSWQLIVK